ncbi:uncharacterized protein LOC131604489 [Vicia villosa]|uniref:uncharacterized protein LOC131604489 n=1 Tax=Vicia villosa TaxID=3911 RepID=UPI00273A905F|nr:uncharacterized protein LOC131604489 [Vicia villosa]
MALEAELEESMAVEAMIVKNENSQVVDHQVERFDGIYDDEPLGFEMDPEGSVKRMQAQDPLEEIDLGDGDTKRPTINGACSNNEVEYEALITGLKALVDLGAMRVEIRGDSELIIRQIKKEYKCIKENLIVYYAMVVRLLEKFEYVEIMHVPRAENFVANELAQIASSYKVSKGKLEELVKVKEKETHEVLDKTGQLSIPKLGG